MTKTDKEQISEKAIWLAVLVAGLGYFVDVFDIWLFSNYRVASLKDLGIKDEDLTTIGVSLLNWQQAGLLIGGFFWGIMGDKKGRTQVMFGSIFLYSLATFLNAFVTDVTQYSILRFISGLGLAGEIGAGITLVSEILPTSKRGIGTTFVTALGVSGALGAAITAKIMSWKSAYIFGGSLGFALLFLRILVHESGLYSKLAERKDVIKGSLLTILSSPKKLLKYLNCVVLGLPLYLCFSLIATFSPEIAKDIGITEAFSVADIMIYASVAFTLGDFLAGTLSQILKSRKKPILFFLFFATLAGLSIPLGVPKSLTGFKIACSLMALSAGYWACLITLSAEQFGTNIRATVATTVPNLVRGSTILMTLAFTALKPSYGVSNSLLIITIVIFSLCYIALWQIKETFDLDLDYIEQ